MFSGHRCVSHLATPYAPGHRGQPKIMEGQLNWESKDVVIAASDCRLCILSFYLASMNFMVAPSWNGTNEIVIAVRWAADNDAPWEKTHIIIKEERKRKICVKSCPVDIRIRNQTLTPVGAGWPLHSPQFPTLPSHTDEFPRVTGPPLFLLPHGKQTWKVQVMLGYLWGDLICREVIATLLVPNLELNTILGHQYKLVFSGSLWKTSEHHGVTQSYFVGQASGCFRRNPEQPRWWFWGRSTRPLPKWNQLSKLQGQTHSSVS